MLAEVLPEKPYGENRETEEEPYSADKNKKSEEENATDEKAITQGWGTEEEESQKAEIMQDTKAEQPLKKEQGIEKSPVGESLAEESPVEESLAEEPQGTSAGKRQGILPEKRRETKRGRGKTGVGKTTGAKQRIYFPTDEPVGDRKTENVVGF